MNCGGSLALAELRDGDSQCVRKGSHGQLTATMTATASHNQLIGLISTADHSEVAASDLGPSLN
jgi:hypothetical protein